MEEGDRPFESFPVWWLNPVLVFDEVVGTEFFHHADLALAEALFYEPAKGLQMLLLLRLGSLIGA
jgi:hypothetical protein